MAFNGRFCQILKRLALVSLAALPACWEIRKMIRKSVRVAMI